MANMFEKYAADREAEQKKIERPLSQTRPLKTRSVRRSRCRSL